ncbi:MAG TPA: acyl-CoA dehydrogenase [Gammaproteobacteria bacterium]|nr:acyl-CoA dehydrogenase [Gammaproteobacteria bacterium]
MIWASIIIATGIIWTLFYFKSHEITWAVLAAGVLSIWTSLDPAGRVPQSITWAIFFILVTPLVYRPLRRKLISNRIFTIFSKMIPTMSSSEKEALDAGSVWWDAELFSGRPDWNKLLQSKTPELTDEENNFIEGPVEELCTMIDDWQITQYEYDLPENVWKFIKQNGFFGMIIPKKFGGLGFSALAHSTIVMKIASRSVTAAVTIMVPNSLGPAELILQYGTEKQQNHYLPRLARGEEIPCFALTGPEAGSDASSMPDTGIICKSDYNGEKDILGVRLNWDKRYITLGPVATLLGLAFHMYDPDGLIGDQKDIGITLALIPTTIEGIEIGHRHFPLNIAFQNGPNRGKDVFIPMDMLIGGQQRAGEGWKMLMECLATGRSISLPALSAGAGKLVSRATGAYSRIRKQFNMPIGKFEGVEEALARIAGFTYQMDAVRQVTAIAVDEGEKPSVLSAIAKYNLTEKMRTVVNDAMDIQGGSAICMGPRNILGRIYQSIPISITVEGANILTRSMIIFGQGVIRCHPYILDIMNSTRIDNTGLAMKKFDRLLFRQIRFVCSNVARTLFTGLTCGRLIRTPENGPEKYYYQQISRMSSAFALLVDTFMLTLGAQLKRKEKVSGRLADILSELYISSAVLKHYKNQGSHPQDLPLLRWSCDTSLNNIKRSIEDLLGNFPIKPLAWLLKRLIFPVGSPYPPATDKTGGEIARMLLEPCPSRFRLTQDIYIPHNTDDPLGRIESALSRVIAAEPVEAYIHEGIKKGLLEKSPHNTLLERAVIQRIITPEQAEIIKAAQYARHDVIMVDEFSADFKKHFDPVTEPLKEDVPPVTTTQENAS